MYCYDYVGGDLLSNVYDEKVLSNFLDFNKPIVEFENLVEFEKIWNYPNEKLKKPSSLFVDAIN